MILNTTTDSFLFLSPFLSVQDRKSKGYGGGFFVRASNFGPQDPSGKKITGVGKEKNFICGSKGSRVCAKSSLGARLYEDEKGVAGGRCAVA